MCILSKRANTAKHMNIAFQKSPRWVLGGENFSKDLDCLLCDLDETERCSAWGKLIRLAFVKVGGGVSGGFFLNHKQTK